MLYAIAINVAKEAIKQNVFHVSVFKYTNGIMYSQTENNQHFIGTVTPNPSIYIDLAGFAIICSISMLYLKIGPK